jgi:hypothetical protein
MKMKYKKKPVQVEAFKFGVDEAPLWFKEKIATGQARVYQKVGSAVLGSDIYDKRACCMVRFKDGEVYGVFGDFIVKEASGDLFVYSPDAFFALHEKAVYKL